MKSTVILIAAALVLSSGPAAANALSANVGAVSTYMFRGIDQTDSDPALQGGLDYVWGVGPYVGVWASNLENGNELDIYGGYTNSAFGMTYDVGAIYYLYTEEDETGQELNTAEIYAGLAFGPVSAKVYFSNDYAGSDEDSMYATIAATLSLSDSLSIVPSLGFSSGDGVEAVFGDEYTDYSLALVKTLQKENVSFSLAVIGTDLDDVNALPGDQGDDPKVVVGVKRTFGI